MSGMYSNGHGNSTKLMENLTCVLKTAGNHTESLQVQAALAIILFPINLFLLICLVFQRKRLLARVVCLYGLNVVLASTVASAIRVYDTFSQNFGKPYLGNEFSSTIKQSDGYLYWWTFEKSTLVMLFLVFYSSIVMIIMAMHKNLMRISGTVAGVSIRGENTSNEALRKSWILVRFKELSKPSKARLAIFLSWFFPILIILISITVDNCSHDYKCPFDYVPETGVPEDVGSRCAHDVAPLANQTVYISTVLCLISLCMLIGALVRSYVDFRRISAELHQHSIHVFHVSRENSVDTTGESPESEPDRTKQHSRTGSLLLEKTKRDLLAIFIISVVYVGGTMASIMFVFIDTTTGFYKKPDSFYPRLVFINLPNVVETISSILLCACIHPISSAIKATLRSILEFACPCLYRLR